MPAGQPTKTGIAAVMRYFDSSDRPMKPGDFRREWAELSETDKNQLKAGIGDLDENGVPSGTMTY